MKLLKIVFKFRKSAHSHFNQLVEIFISTLDYYDKTRNINIWNEYQDRIHRLLEQLSSISSAQMKHLVGNLGVNSIRTNMPQRLEEELYPALCKSIITPYQIMENATVCEASFVVDNMVASCLLKNDIEKFNSCVRIRSYLSNQSAQKHEWPNCLKEIYVNSVSLPFLKKIYTRTQDNLIRTTGANIPLFIHNSLQPGTNVVKLILDEDPSKKNYVICIELLSFLCKSEVISYVALNTAFSKKEFGSLGKFC
jgi:hypothetical protein